jgi:hypothetical protein
MCICSTYTCCVSWSTSIITAESPAEQMNVFVTQMNNHTQNTRILCQATRNASQIQTAINYIHMKWCSTISQLVFQEGVRLILMQILHTNDFPCSLVHHKKSEALKSVGCHFFTHC